MFKPLNSFLVAFVVRTKFQPLHSTAIFNFTIWKAEVKVNILTASYSIFCLQRCYLIFSYKPKKFILIWVTYLSVKLTYAAFFNLLTLLQCSLFCTREGINNSLSRNYSLYLNGKCKKKIFYWTEKGIKRKKNNKNHHLV